MSYNIDDAILELKELSIDTPKKPKLPSDDLLDQYEKKINFQFSEDYRKFLKQASDVFVGTLSPLVITEDSNSQCELSAALSDAREIGIPHNWLPICEDNGDYYCLANGHVRFWSHNGVTDESWSSLAEWIKDVWIEEG